MLIVETIAKIRLAYFSRKMTIKAICRDLRVSRKVVRKVIRSQAPELHYQPTSNPGRKSGLGASGLSSTRSPDRKYADRCALDRPPGAADRV
jgi:hypothetical protein